MRAKFLTEKEIHALRARMGARAWMPYQIALETGLRIGDVAKLTWNDIQGSLLTYTAQKTGKKGSARLTSTTAEQLWTWRRTARSDWVFPAPHDPASHLTRQALWKRLKVACKACGISADGVSPHSMRKVYGVREYRAHGMAAAQAGLQHTDIGTTEIYVLADWLTDENADKPLLRSDMARILHFIADWLGISKSAPTDPERK